MTKQLDIILSKKQNQLRNDIIAPYVPEIYVLGSTQSGKTFDICLALIEYARLLHNYDNKKQYNCAIVGWAINTIKGNIVDVIDQFLQDMGYKKKVSVKSKGDYILKWSTDDEKYLKLWNIKFYFFGFNNILAFNKILS